MPRKRRTKAELDPAILDKILAVISVGASKKDAAAHVGISDETLRRYEKRGEQGEEPFASWLVKMRAAQVETKVYVLGLLQRATAGDWKAGAWLLERLYPKEFGKHIDVEHSGRVEQSHDLSALSKSELLELRRLRKKIEKKEG